MTRWEDMPRVAGVVVDVHALGSIEHECRPELCREGGVCCAGYDICVEEWELDKLSDGVALATNYAPHLADGPPPFSHAFGDLYSLDTDEDGLCVYAWKDERGSVLCSIHSAALDRGLDLREVKPRPCLLWPLAESGSEPPYLSVDPEAFKYPCNRRRPFDGRLHESIRQHVGYLFGEEFLEELDAAARRFKG
jgi:hypothetical protein